MSLQNSLAPDGSEQPNDHRPGETTAYIVGRAVSSMDRTLRVLEETERRLQELMHQMVQAQKRSRKSLMVDAATIGLLAAVTAFLVMMGLGVIAYLVAF